MANPITNYMKNWLNTTYKYLDETGGPVRPPVTVGPNVLPTGAFTPVTDLPENYYVSPAFISQPFNPGNMGLPILNKNKNDTNEEIAKENPIPIVVADGFQRIYGAVGMHGCLNDQIHGRANPHGQKACENFAATGDTSLLILTPARQKLLGITPTEKRDKPDDAQAAENKLTLTEQIAQGGGAIVAGINTLLPGGGGGGGTGIDSANGDGGANEGNVFKNIEKAGEWMKGLVPNIPSTPGINTGSIIMIGGGILLLIMVITIIK